MGVGAGVGAAVGLAVGAAVGDGVGEGVGDGVGDGVGTATQPVWPNKSAVHVFASHTSHAVLPAIAAYCPLGHSTHVALRPSPANRRVAFRYCPAAHTAHSASSESFTCASSPNILPGHAKQLTVPIPSVYLPVAQDAQVKAFTVSL